MTQALPLRTEAAARLVDLWMGNDQGWRTRLDESDFLESADWKRAMKESDIVLSVVTTPDTIARLTAEPAGEDVERLALVLLNDDRVAAGLSPAASRENIPDSDGYVRNVRALLAALHPTDHIADAGKKVPTDDLRRTREAEARECAARVFDKLARKAEHPEVAALNRHHAKVIRAGEGDDYDAVQAAMNALSTVSKECEHG